MASTPHSSCAFLAQATASPFTSPNAFSSAGTSSTASSETSAAMTGLLGISPSQRWNGSTVSPPVFSDLSPAPRTTSLIFPLAVSTGRL